MEWVVVIPVKRLADAKTRIGEPLAAYRRDLALAFAADTTAAALHAVGVRAVVVVTDDAVVSAELRTVGAAVVPDSAPGLNAAVSAGASESRRMHPLAGVAALVGDLPALRPADLTAALAAATAYDRAFGCDASGIGTTLLCAAANIELAPAFGPRSRAAHRASGAVELVGPWPSLRRDVDDAVDLADARRLGVGRATSAVLGRIQPAVGS